MVQIFSPMVTKLVQHMKQDLEMIGLLTRNHIDQRIERPIFMPVYCSTDILSEVERCAILSKQHLLVKIDICQVDPDRPITFPVEDSLLQPLENGVFAKGVGVTLIIVVVERHSGFFICLRDTVKSPSVHRIPKCEYFGITLFPLLQHELSLFCG